MQINERGYWENNSREGHGGDWGLAKAILRFLKDEGDVAVVDIGCGDGFYVDILEKGGIPTIGYDGNPYTNDINKLCYTKDFTIPMLSNWRYEWAICLEVGEHIPPQYEEIFIDNLTKCCTKGIILSWSIPEYGGDGHVNSLENAYVIERMFEKGFRVDVDATKNLRNSVAEYPTPCYWFRKTLMCFRRNNGI